MGLTDDEKLRNFEEEAVSEARKISDEINSKNRVEFKEKIEEGEKRLLREMFDYVQLEVDRIRKDKGLELSKINIKTRQDYLKYSDTIILTVFEKVNEKLKVFIKSPEYSDFLKKSVQNITVKLGYDLKIYYMPDDEALITKIKGELCEINSDFGRLIFEKDESIKSGGLIYFDSQRNILVNDVLEQKKERAKSMLGSLIGPYFKDLS